jgi:hypothetical protein
MDQHQRRGVKQSIKELTRCWYIREVVSGTSGAREGLYFYGELGLTTESRETCRVILSNIPMIFAS